MVIDISLAVVFVVSVVILWYRLSVKIPELIAVSDQVITARLEEDSARFRLFVAHLKAYYFEKRYRETFYRIFSKALYRVHVVLLRLDNGIANLLKKIRAKQGANGGNGNGVIVISSEILPKEIQDGNKYWKSLKTEPASSQKEINRIQEIKPR